MNEGGISQSMSRKLLLLFVVLLMEFGCTYNPNTKQREAQIAKLYRSYFDLSMCGNYPSNIEQIVSHYIQEHDGTVYLPDGVHSLSSCYIYHDGFLRTQPGVLIEENPVYFPETRFFVVDGGAVYSYEAN